MDPSIIEEAVTGQNDFEEAVRRAETAVAQHIGYPQWPEGSINLTRNTEFLKTICDYGMCPGLTRQRIDEFEREAFYEY